MAVINKGISKAVREAFINGTHDESAMLVQLAHLNTDENRRAYIITLTKAMREKYGMKTKRDVRFGKSKKKPATNLKQAKNMMQQILHDKKLTSDFKPPIALELADAMRKHDMSNIVEVRKKVYKETEDDVTAEYVKLDDDYKALQVKYDDLFDSISELKREITRLNVIVTYLEGRK